MTGKTQSGGNHESGDSGGDSPKSYIGIARDWLSNYRWAAWMLAIAVVVQLVVGAVMAVHTYVYAFEIYSPGQFDHLAWWMYVGDIVIHAYLLYRVSMFLSGRAESDTLIDEFKNHPMWIYLFATSAAMVLL